MRGRIFHIKKTTILSVSFWLAILLSITAIVLSMVLFQNFNIWFYFFSLFCGIYLSIKSALFGLDSSCYFGSLLTLVGAFGILIDILHLFEIQSVYFLLSFSFASFTTYCFYSQKFQLYIAIALFFVTTAWFLCKINLLSIWIFIAIVVACMLSFIVRYLVQCYRCKRS